MLLKNLYVDGAVRDILIENGLIVKIGNIDGKGIDCTGLTALPAFVDLHVHLREPGYEHKETIYTGTLAARRGGFSTVFCMPNTMPVCDSPETVRYIMSRTAFTDVYTVGAITKGQRGTTLEDFGTYRDCGVKAVSDDGMPVADDALLERAMYSAKKNCLLLISHCENKALISDRLDIPSAAEYTDVKRVLRFAIKTGAAVHLAHISTKESVAAIREAKAAGADVTAETCPHYFTLTRAAVNRFGANAMMNPPLRDEEDVYAVTQGLVDGTLDMISTDHAPHSAEEKNGALRDAPFGIIGLETSFPLSYTALVKTGIISLNHLCTLMSHAPAKRAGIAVNTLLPGSEANIAVAELNKNFIFNKEKCLSKARNTPFDGTQMCGAVIYSIRKGELFECPLMY